ncbi:Fpg/Nei family DNA glycosylase [Archangium primigenium]|uniref:Fpg/Nei family DNA glycosylase n=1 Tax=[Archangium] primigenium TaxID=2792470 RepID=UPI00195C0DE8|nr:Fpg/Nei family DNA glycosylase [Archangium primigenium]MBM7117568.1 Fpg/Nei family DNA glycosylase [Archangium primigenium]
MPEGNIIHRLARVHRRWLVGRRFTADSPQGRFAAEAPHLSGRVLEDVRAHGKHLFHHFEGGVRLHVHLGLFGTIRHFRAQATPPSPACRLRLASPHATLQLSGPQTCELLTPDAEAALRARLGEDPLHADASRERAFAALRQVRAPIATALLDQSRISGVGNILRAEALFLARLSPHLPASDLRAPDFERLWTALRQLLEDAARDGRIVPPHAPPTALTLPGRRREDRFCVYDREDLPCPHCATPVARVPLAGRSLFFCPRCQAPRRRAARARPAPGRARP